MDINLLPVDKREIESKEEKKKTEEKSRLRIEMTSPEKQEKPPGQIKGGFWRGVKRGLKSIIKKSKPKKEDRKKQEQYKKIDAIGKEAQPQIPRHFDDIKVKEQKKEFFHQPVQLSEQADLPVKPVLELKVSKKEKKQQKKGEKEKKKLELKELRQEKKKQKEIEKLKNKEKKEKGKKEKQARKELERQQAKEKKGKKEKPKQDEEPKPEAKKEDVKEEFSQAKIAPQLKASRLDINLIPGTIKGMMTARKKVRLLIIVVIICILICGTVYFSLERVVASRQAKIEKLELDINDLKIKNDNLKETNQEVTAFMRLLGEVKKKIEKHIFATQFFPLLQKNTLKNVYYSQMQVDFVEQTASLAANAKDYKTLAEQLLIFQSLPEIINVGLSRAAVDEEELTDEDSEEIVTFDLVLKLKSSVWQQK